MRLLLGDILILALNSDANGQRIEGPPRPLIALQERTGLGTALAAVDAVTLFEENTPREPIPAVLPDVLVKGAGWRIGLPAAKRRNPPAGKFYALPVGVGHSATGTAG